MTTPRQRRTRISSIGRGRRSRLDLLRDKSSAIPQEAARVISVGADRFFRTAVTTSEAPPPVDPNAPPATQLTPEIIGKLRSEQDLPKVREELGLPQTATVDSFLQQPDALLALNNPAVSPRVHEFAKEAHEEHAKRIEGRRRSFRQILHAADQTGVLKTIDDLQNWITPTEADPIDPGSLRAIVANALPDSLNKTPAAKARANEEFELMQHMVAGPFDVVGQTIGEFLETGGAVAATGDISELRAPTIFQRGFSQEALQESGQEAIEKFEERPLMEQFALGLADPLVALTAVKGAVKGFRFLAADPIPRALAKHKGQQEALELANSLSRVSPLSTNDEVLGQVQPRTRLSGLGTGKLRRVLDPSSEIPLLEPGSPDRTILEVKVLGSRLTEQGIASKELTLNRILERGDPDFLFGIKAREDPLAHSITHAADGSPLSKPPFAGDVFERPDNFRLTFAQRQWVDEVHATLDEALQYAKAEGVNVKELGSLDEAFHYFPRRVLDKETGKSVLELVHAKTGQIARIGKHRIHETMEEFKTTHGSKYAGPKHALDAYFTSLYREVVRQRQIKHSKPLLRTLAADPKILKQARKSRNTLHRMSLRVQDAKRMPRGFIPSGQTLKSMKRLFPKLEGRIDAVMTLKAPEVDAIIREVSREVMRATKISRPRLRKAILELQQQAAPIRKPQFKKLPASFKRGFSARQQAVLDEYAELAKKVRTAEDEIDLRFPEHTPEQAQLLREGRDIEFSRARGYSEEQIADFQEFVALSERARELGIDDEDLLDVEHAIGTIVTFGQGRGRIPQRPDLTQPRDLFDALSKLNVENEAARALVAEVESKGLKALSQARQAEIRALTDRMDQWFDVAKEQNELVQRAASHAKQRARQPSFSAVVPSLGPNYIVDKEIAQALEKAIVDSGNTVTAAFSNLNGAIRTMRTAIDVGANFIQGLPILFNEPAAWAKSTELQYRALLDPRVRSAYIRANAFDIQEMINHGGVLGSTEFTESLERGGWLAGVNRIASEGGTARQILGAPVRGVYVATERFSNAFETFLDVARVETWKAMRPTVNQPRDLDALASFVNTLTGTSSSRALGVPLTQRQFEAALPFFAPRYMRAMAGLVMDTTRGGLRGEWARRSIGRMFAGMTAVYMAGATALGHEPHLDPTKPAEFFRWEIAGQRVGFGGKLLTFLKSAAKIAKASYESPEGFLQWNIFDAQDYRDNPLLSFMRNQSSPIASTALTFASGADPLGRMVPSLHDPIDLMDFTGEETFPFWVDAAREAWDANNPAGAIVAGVSEFTGLVSFPEPTYDKLNALYDQHAQQDYGAKSWDELKRTRDFNAAAEKRAMLARHDDLRALQETLDAEESTRLLAQRRITARNRLADINAQYAQELNRNAQVFNELVYGAEAPRKFRSGWSIAAAKRKGAIENLRQEYGDVFADIEDYYSLLAEDSESVAAMQHFFDLITSNKSEGGPIDDDTGIVDHFRVEELREEIDEVWGEGMMERIDKELDARKRAPVTDANGEQYWLDPRNLEYLNSFRTLQPFWNAYQTALPEEQHRQWRRFVQSSESVQEALRRNPDIRRMERAVEREQELIKRDNADVDMALLIFYGRRPSNNEVKSSLLRQMREYDIR